MHIFDIFEKAKQTLKWPKLKYPHENQMIEFSLAGPNARMPGTINITDGKQYPNKFYGRVIKDNEARKLRFQWNEKQQRTEDLTAIIKAIVENPVGMCSLIGQQYAHCCFCGLELTNKNSVLVGYGPICAEKWGLPWDGMAEAKEKKELRENL